MRPTPWRRLRVVGVPALVLVLGLAGWLLWRRAGLYHAVRSGIELAAGADTPEAEAAALARWEQALASDWPGRREALVDCLLSEHSLSEPGVRTLLRWITGADYGTRLEDWRRWRENRRRLRSGEPLQVRRKERISLGPRWQAPVGLTSWFSTILPLDGVIYVASLGQRFGQQGDPSGGIVRVDGKDGSAALFYRPQPGAGDILGLSAGQACLFAACERGVVSCISPDGQERWHAAAGGALAGIPLSVDINRDGVTDVAVVRRDGRVVAFSGHSGRTVWVSPPHSGRVEEEDDLGASLALGPVTGGDRRELLVTSAAGGLLRVLRVRDGTLVWEQAFEPGTLTGAVAWTVPDRVGPPAYVGDRLARIWSLVRTPDGLAPVRTWDLRLRPGDGLVAALRTLSRGDLPPLVVACPTGEYYGDHGSVCGLVPGEVRWRYPLEGAVWATPALADINGDGVSEIVVASVDNQDPDETRGRLTVLSAEGHCLYERSLSAPAVGTPVVADVDGDQRLEVLVADLAGYLHCFATGRIGPVEWGLYAGDSHNTRNADNAYSFGQAPCGTQWSWRPP